MRGYPQQPMGLGPTSVEEIVDWFRSSTVALFGLPPSEPVQRLLGEAHREWIDDRDGEGPRKTRESFGLLHGDPVSATERRLQVITSTIPGRSQDELLSADADRSGTSFTVSSSESVEMTFQVDGRPVLFRGLKLGKSWVASTTVSDWDLSVVGFQWPPSQVSLSRISDIEPYVTGYKKYLESMGNLRNR